MANDPLWIEHAHLNKGALTKKADKAGETPRQFAEGHKDAPGKTGKQSRLAITLNRYRGAHE